MILVSERKKAFKAIWNAILPRPLAPTAHLLLEQFELVKQLRSMTVQLWTSLISSRKSEPKRFKSDLRLPISTVTVSLQSVSLVLMNEATSNRSVQLTELYELLNYEHVTTSAFLKSARRQHLQDDEQHQKGCGWWQGAHSPQLHRLWLR